MSEDRYLTFALGKGRLANKTLDLLEQIGITCEEMKDKNTRKLIFVNEELKLKFFLSKALDVPTYVEYGAADIGVVGKDTILEENRRVYEVLASAGCAYVDRLLQGNCYSIMSGSVLQASIRLLPRIIFITKSIRP